MFRYSLILLSLGCLILPLNFSLKIPASFSNDHSSYELTTENFDSDEVLRILVKYEIDNHLDVVIIGDSIFNDKNKINKLSTHLDHLTSLASRAAATKFVNEKTIFHIVPATGLYLSLKNELSMNKLSEKLIENTLSQYHKNSASTSTLFLVFDDTSLSSNANVISHKREYRSKLYSECFQSTFISKDNFAWVDFGAKLSIISRIQNLIYLPEYSIDMKSALSNEASLASFIYRTSEALLPVVDTSERFLMNSQPFLFPMQLHILIITIASSATFNCKAHSIAYNTIKKILDSNVNSFLRLTFENECWKMFEHPQLLHLYQTSVFPNSQINGEKGFGSIDSKEIINLLSNSDLLRNAINAHQQPDSILVPVVIFELSETNPLLIDGKHSAITSSLPNPIGVVDNDLDGTLAQSTVWPHTMVIAINDDNIAKLLDDSELSADVGFRCDDKRLSNSNQFFYRELWNSMRAAIWGISAPDEYLSAISNEIVHDFLWSPADTLRSLDDDLSFRELRSIPRHMLINQAEKIMQRFAAAIKYSDKMVPKLDIFSLLDIDDNSAEKSVKGNRPIMKEKVFSQKSSGKDESKKKNINNAGLFESFLVSMDAVSSDYSHADYNAAASQLLNAEAKVIKLETILRVAASKRVGNIFCSPLSIGSNDSTATTNDNSATSDDSIDGNDVDSTSASSDDENIADSSYLNIFLVFFCLLGGIVLGIYFEVSDRYRNYRKRGGALL